MWTAELGICEDCWEQCKNQPSKRREWSKLIISEWYLEKISLVIKKDHHRCLQWLYQSNCSVREKDLLAGLCLSARQGKVECFELTWKRKRYKTPCCTRVHNKEQVVFNISPSLEETKKTEIVRCVMRDKEALDILLNQIIQYRQKTLFLKLVQAGLDVHYHIIQTNILDQERWKPMLPSGRAIMHQAILWDVRWLVDYLLKEGYDVNLQSPIGCSPLLWAIRNCQVGDEAAKRNLIHSLIDQPDCRLDLPA